AIALFNMVRAPLNVIPTWIVQILQVRLLLLLFLLLQIFPRSLQLQLQHIDRRRTQPYRSLPLRRRS
ncbi:hypothetical protein H0H93_003772, partial [Arthromyces matolae]